MKVSQEELDELRQDMLLEDRRDELIECQMRSDVYYCINQTDYDSAMDELEKVLAVINGYGHELSLKDLLEFR